MNIENFLIDNGFVLDTYFREHKTFVKEITDRQNLYVSISGDKIDNVEYEEIAVLKHEVNKKISFETIETFERVLHLVNAFAASI